MPEINRLFPTRHRKAFLRAVNEPLRIYMHREDKVAWDNKEGVKVNARLREAFDAGWVEPIPDEDRTPLMWRFLIYYRLTGYGRIALGLVKDINEEKSSNG